MADERTPVRSYSTHFELDEDPISEGGIWLSGRKDGIDWLDVISKNGVGYGAVSRMGVPERRIEQGNLEAATSEDAAPEGDYDDPTAVLAGTSTSGRSRSGSATGVEDGDLIGATVEASVLEGFINGVEVISATDDTYSEGAPGIGFDFGVSDTNVDHGFSYFEVDTYDD